jgi:purine-binding chemotaxis protein CheW
MKTPDIDKKKSYTYFTIGRENFAIHVQKVLEILYLDRLTEVPNSSEFVKGILNFRGNIIPVINLEKRFNFPDNGHENRMVIVVEMTYQDKAVMMGLLVNEVVDVLEISFKDIKVVPDIGIRYNPEFLEGFVEHDGKFIMIMDVDKVLSPVELAKASEEDVPVSE